MKKQFAINALKKIKAINLNATKLAKLGVNVWDLQSGVDLLEEGIAAMFTDNEKDFETALEHISWWVYEKCEKVIHFKHGTPEASTIEVITPEQFIEWLEGWYQNN